MTVTVYLDMATIAKLVNGGHLKPVEKGSGVALRLPSIEGLVLEVIPLEGVFGGDLRWDVGCKGNPKRFLWAVNVPVKVPQIEHNLGYSLNPFRAQTLQECDSLWSLCKQISGRMNSLRSKNAQ